MDYLDLLTLPESSLAMTLLGLVLSEVCYSGEKVRLFKMTALSGLGLAFVQTLVAYQLIPATLFSDAVILDGLSLFVRLFLILLAGISVLTISSSEEVPRSRSAEYVILVMGATLAASLVVSANDLVLLYVGLLVFTLMCAVLASFGKASVQSTEAGFKYLIFGSAISSFLLIAGGVLFVHAGTANLLEVHNSLMRNPLDLGANSLVFGLFFLVVCSLLGIFPMQFWLPDVLQGAPTPVSGFVSVATRFVGFALGTRVLMMVFATQGESGDWQSLGSVDWSSTLTFFAGASFVLGGLLSIRQTSAKRLVAYLLMVESGYLLMGMMLLDPHGIAAGLFSLIVTLFASTGVYFVLGYFSDRLGSDEISVLRGATRVSIPAVLALVFFLVCLVGLPPLPGFIGKFTLIGSVINHQRYGLALTAIAGIAMSTVAVVRLALNLVGNYSEIFRAGALTPVAAATAQGRESPMVERGTHLLIAVLMVPLLVLAFQSDWVLKWGLRSITLLMTR